MVEDKGVYQANVARHLEKENGWRIFPYFFGFPFPRLFFYFLFYFFSPDLLHPSQLSLLLGLGNFEHQIGRDALEHHLEGEDEDLKLDDGVDDNEW